MKRAWQLGLMLAALMSAAGGTGKAAVPVIYSTDLLHPADDPDDHFDLACLFSMPEADLRAVVLDQGDRQAQRPGHRAVWQLNRLAGRHVPAAIGLRDKLKGPDDQGLDQPAEFQNGVQLILQTLKDAPEKAAVLFVGSARDVVAACNREPRLFRDKVRSIHGFIGDAGEPTHREWNVGLDPQAFVGLLRSEVPFYWLPCFDGGPWTNNGHATFWRVKHGQLLEKTPPSLQRYFLYMLRQSTNDPIAFLSEPMPAAERAWLMGGDRNMWCGALLGLAVGRPLLGAGPEPAGFAPVDVWVDDAAVVHSGKASGSRTVMRFEIRDRERYAEAATRSTARLLEAFPVAQGGGPGKR